MKKILLILALAVPALVFVGCEELATTDKKQAAQTELIQDRLNSRFGLPAMVNGTEKRLVKELYELRDQADLVTYTYTFSEVSGKLRYLGKSIGFGIPASVQYSNPEKRVRRHSSNYGYNIPLAEPNGLFMPEGLSATWVFLINPHLRKAEPTYVEPLITVSLFPLEYAEYPGAEAEFNALRDEYVDSKK